MCACSQKHKAFKILCIVAFKGIRQACNGTCLTTLAFCEVTGAILPLGFCSRCELSCCPLGFLEGINQMTWQLGSHDYHVLIVSA